MLFALSGFLFDVIHSQPRYGELRSQRGNGSNIYAGGGEKTNVLQGLILSYDALSVDGLASNKRKNMVNGALIGQTGLSRFPQAFPTPLVDVRIASRACMKSIDAAKF